MGKNKQQKKKTAVQENRHGGRWNETELRLATGAITLVAAFILSRVTGVGPEAFYGSFQRFISGFFVLVLLYLIIYVVLYRRFRS